MTVFLPNIPFNSSTHIINKQTFIFRLLITLIKLLMFHAHFSFALDAWNPEFAAASVENNFEHLFPNFNFPVVGGQSFLQSNIFIYSRFHI